MTKKYRAVITVSFPIDEGPDNHQEAHLLALRLFNENFPAKNQFLASINAKANPISQKIKLVRMERIGGPFVADDILPFIVDERRMEGAKKQYEYEGVHYLVKMTSKRYQTFKRDSCKCVSCGLEGTHFYLEKDINNQEPHFNLYAIKDNVEILITKDHIWPVSKGGGDRLDNLQTMCATCNTIKGKLLISNDEVNRRREDLESNKGIQVDWKRQDATLSMEKEVEAAIPLGIIENVGNIKTFNGNPWETLKVASRKKATFVPRGTIFEVLGGRPDRNSVKVKWENGILNINGNYVRKVTHIKQENNIVEQAT